MIADGGFKCDGTVTTVEALAWTAWGACHLQWEHLGGSKRAGDTCSYKPLRVPRSSEIHGTCQVPHEGKSLVCLATGTQGQSGQTGAGTQGMSDMSQAGSMGAGAGSMPAPDSTMSGVPGGGSSSAFTFLILYQVPTEKKSLIQQAYCIELVDGQLCSLAAASVRGMVNLIWSP
ncbi:hypothetical protein EV360DRAFT_72779 [Lentinula raphanica]|nr:hypothetical protein EV360DRAFT_72779 [Lentinula raphanica]